MLGLHEHGEAFVAEDLRGVVGDLDDGVLVADAGEITCVDELIDAAEEDFALHAFEEAVGAEGVMAAACDFFGLRAEEDVCDVTLTEGLPAADDAGDDLSCGVVRVSDGFEFLQAEVARGAGGAGVLLAEMFDEGTVATAELGAEAVHLVEEAELAGEAFVSTGVSGGTLEAPPPPPPVPVGRPAPPTRLTVVVRKSLYIGIIKNFRFLSIF
jgi:hypothetical protein